MKHREMLQPRKQEGFQPLCWCFHGVTWVVELALQHLFQQPQPTMLLGTGHATLTVLFAPYQGNEAAVVAPHSPGRVAELPACVCHLAAVGQAVNGGG